MCAIPTRWATERLFPVSQILLVVSKIFQPEYPDDRSHMAAADRLKSDNVRLSLALCLPGCRHIPDLFGPFYAGEKIPDKFPKLSTQQRAAIPPIIITSAARLQSASRTRPGRTRERRGFNNFCQLPWLDRKQACTSAAFYLLLCAQRFPFRRRQLHQSGCSGVWCKSSTRMGCVQKTRTLSVGFIVGEFWLASECATGPSVDLFQWLVECERKTCWLIC